MKSFLQQRDWRSWEETHLVRFQMLQSRLSSAEIQCNWLFNALTIHVVIVRLQKLLACMQAPDPCRLPIERSTPIEGRGTNHGMVHPEEHQLTGFVKKISKTNKCIRWLHVEQ